MTYHMKLYHSHAAAQQLCCTNGQTRTRQKPRLCKRPMWKGVSSIKLFKSPYPSLVIDPLERQNGRRPDGRKSGRKPQFGGHARSPGHAPSVPTLCRVTK
ncbi:unnamed protein product, partial [Iphiclides podalirius]